MSYAELIAGLTGFMFNYWTSMLKDFFLQGFTILMNLIFFFLLIRRVLKNSLFLFKGSLENLKFVKGILMENGVTKGKFNLGLDFGRQSLL